MAKIHATLEATWDDNEKLALTCICTNTLSALTYRELRWIRKYVYSQIYLRTTLTDTDTLVECEYALSLFLTTHSDLPEAHHGPVLILILKARFIWCHCFSFWLVNRDMTSDTQKTKGTEISYNVQRQMTWILQINSLFLQPPTFYAQPGHTNTTKLRQKGKHNQFSHIHDRFMYFNIQYLLCLATVHR